ncbi:ATP5C1 [Cordylochernes scorpioides]|uniref:ATP5C1 n=1 Tax=Cordylochernes scorpioides TaxID=51811 RepID=A0ABY6LRK1_9ARAC|nr:ATP5C1 [Cordylochernes scorpioides]
MKMVSAAKYARAERELKSARSYGLGAQTFYEQAELNKEEEAEKPKPTLLIAVSSDRGLCGAIHSSVGKRIKAISGPAAEAQTQIICVGDKARALLQRDYANCITQVFTDFGKKPPIFQDAVVVANAILAGGQDFTIGSVIYNRFKSVVSYETKEAPVYSSEVVNQSSKIALYDSVDAEVLQSYQEFTLASIIYYAMKENACSEQSSRMTAMDGASKNAGKNFVQMRIVVVVSYPLFEAVPNTEAFAADSNMSTDAVPPYPWSGTPAEVQQLGQLKSGFLKRSFSSSNNAAKRIVVVSVLQVEFDFW